MTRTRWILFALISIVTLGALVLLSKKDNVDVANTDPTLAVSETATSVGDHVYGDKSSKVVLIEYGDFQCPGCAGAHPQIKTLKETYKDKIAFIFRNFPITTIHPNALAASTAAEAAGLQGKFWEMHDKLYENQQAWGSIDASKRTDVFVGYAEDIGLDVTQFREDLSNPKVNEKINRDRAFAQKVGVSSTPTFYIGDKKLSEEATSKVIQGDVSQLRDALDAALKTAGVEPPQR